MKLNAFEGARRIAKLVAVLWAMGCVVMAIFGGHHGSVQFLVAGFESPPVILMEGGYCGTPNAPAYTNAEWTRGVSVTFCFMATKTTDGKMRIPYAKAEDGGYWVHDAYSTEVTKYAEATVAAYRPTKSDLEEIDKEVWRARIDRLKDAGLTFVGGMVFIWLFTAAVGWVVRGFMGIPRGQDKRPEA